MPDLIKKLRSPLDLLNHCIILTVDFWDVRTLFLPLCSAFWVGNSRENSNRILEATSIGGWFKLNRPFLLYWNLIPSNIDLQQFKWIFPAKFISPSCSYLYKQLPLCWPETRSSSHLYKPDWSTANLICLLWGNRQWSHFWNWEL